MLKKTGLTIFPKSGPREYQALAKWRKHEGMQMVIINRIADIHAKMDGNNTNC